MNQSQFFLIDFPENNKVKVPEVGINFEQKKLSNHVLIITKRHLFGTIWLSAAQNCSSNNRLFLGMTFNADFEVADAFVFFHHRNTLKEESHDSGSSRERVAI